MGRCVGVEGDNPALVLDVTLTLGLTRNLNITVTLTPTLTPTLNLTPTLDLNPNPNPKPYPTPNTRYRDECLGFLVGCHDLLGQALGPGLGLRVRGLGSRRMETPAAWNCVATLEG